MKLIPDKPAEIDFIIHRGADYSIPMTFRESADGDAIDLTGISFSCEFIAEADDDTQLQTPVVTVTDAAGGAISITIPRASTEDVDMMPVDHLWRLWWTDGGGNRQLKASGSVRMERM